MPTMVVLVLDNVDYLEEVLEAWWEAGAPGVTMLESSGAARYFARRGARDDLPIFPTLGSLLAHQETHHRTLFTILKDGSDVEKLFDVTEAVVGPLDGPNNGIMFALPVLHARGLQRGQPAR
jgi:hypothetical protein